MSVPFSKGDEVEVWSNSKKEWMTDGTVLEVALEDCELDGYSIPQGAVKVSSAAGTKWVMPDQVLANVRKKTGASPVYADADRISSRTPSARPLCRHGCGRPVQPGLTKGMRPFDTCCKKCAMSEGSGGHDANCGGAHPVSAASSGRRGLNPKLWLEQMITDGIRDHTEKVMGGATELAAAKVKEAVEERLMEPIGVKLNAPDWLVTQWIEKYGQASKGVLDARGMQELIKKIVRDRYNEWFPERLQTSTTSMVRKNPSPLESIYDFGDMLGEGSFGKVFSVTHKVSGAKRVCKTIEKNKGLMEVEEILQEIQSMAMLDHPNVIKVYEYFEDAGSISQIMEPCVGGELQDKIDAVFKHRSQEPYTEKFICDVMKQLLRALAFMHGERVMHKDLKPQNIMLVDKDLSSIKVIDFGLVELFKPDQKVSDNFGGTLLYMAPEVFAQELTMKVDIWSAGVILYNLLTGDYPYLATWPLPPGRDMEWWQQEVARQIREDPYKPHRRLDDDRYSDACKDMLNQMLIKDATRRPNAAQCLEHAWFRQFDDFPPPLSVGVTQCLGAFAGQPELKKAIFLLIAHQSAPPAIEELRAIFTHFDVTNRGTLELSSLQEVLRQSGMPELPVQRVIHAIDRDGSGYIQWSEFLAAALCISVCGDKRLVGGAFSVLDTNQDGQISMADVEQAFAAGAESSIAERWKEKLPSEWAELDVGAGGFATREQFEKYVGQKMKITSGDTLCAVAT